MKWGYRRLEYKPKIRRKKTKINKTYRLFIFCLMSLLLLLLFCVLLLVLLVLFGLFCCCFGDLFLTDLLTCLSRLAVSFLSCFILHVSMCTFLLKLLKLASEREQNRQLSPKSIKLFGLLLPADLAWCCCCCCCWWCCCCCWWWLGVCCWRCCWLKFRAWLIKLAEDEFIEWVLKLTMLPSPFGSTLPVDWLKLCELLLLGLEPCLSFLFLVLQWSKCNFLLKLLKLANDRQQYMHWSPNSMPSLFKLSSAFLRDDLGVMLPSMDFRILQFSTCIFLLNSFKLASGLLQNRQASPPPMDVCGVLLLRTDVFGPNMLAEEPMGDAVW